MSFIKQYSLHIASLVLLILWLFAAQKAGISGDEYVHNQQAEYVLDYYASWGNDQSALQTPETNLKYYGQAYDNLASLLARIFSVEDVFSLRHLMSVFAAWLTVVFTFLLGEKIGGIWLGLLSAILLLLSPRFIGHSFNNLKDIPFALGNIATIYYLIRWRTQLPKTDKHTMLGLILSIAFTISIRPSGLLMICYAGLIVLIWIIQNRSTALNEWKALFFNFTLITVSAYLLGILFWPYALENPLWHPLKAHIVMSDYPVTMRQIFEGKVYWSDLLPWYYPLKYMAISLPIPLIVLLISSPLLYLPIFKKHIELRHINFLFFVFLFPLLFVFIKSSNLYGGIRHFLFLFPIICILSSMLFNALVQALGKKFLQIGIICILALGLVSPLKSVIGDHPYQYTYFNQIIGGTNEAEGKYEIDYYYVSLREACLKLESKLETEASDTIVIASNFRIEEYLKGISKTIKTKYVPYYSKDNELWDYGVFVSAHLYPYNEESIHWPPADLIDSVAINGVLLCALLKNQDNWDFEAKEAYSSKKYTEAIGFALKSLETNPNSLSTNLILGKSYLQNNELGKAEAAIRNCLNILPGYEPASLKFAEIKWLKGTEEEAIAELEYLIDFNPKYTQAYLQLSKWHIENGEKRRAIEVLVQGLNFLPGNKEMRQQLEMLN